MSQHEYQIHEAANAFPMFGEKELQDLAEDIKRNGQKMAICLYDGKVLDGRNRLAACNLLGIKPQTKNVYPDDPYLWVWSLNGERRHLSSDEQKYLIWRKLHGMSHDMMQEREAIQAEANRARSEAAKSQPRKQGDDGKVVFSGSCTDCTTTSKPKVAKTRKAEAKAAGVNIGAVARASALEKQSPELAEKVMGGEITYADAKRKSHVHVSQNSGNNEWYTPGAFIDAARATMGGIDTDPATSEIANQTVSATSYYTEKDNGLKQTWSGRVWMNPPYAQPLIAQFCEHLVDQFKAGTTTQACVLVNNATETAWFQGLAATCSALCLIKGRVKFLDPNGKPGAPLQGQAILYLGENVQQFRTSFAGMGEVFVHE